MEGADRPRRDEYELGEDHRGRRRCCQRKDCISRYILAPRGVAGCEYVRLLYYGHRVGGGCPSTSSKLSGFYKSYGIRAEEDLRRSAYGYAFAGNTVHTCSYDNCYICRSQRGVEFFTVPQQFFVTANGPETCYR